MMALLCGLVPACGGGNAGPDEPEPRGGPAFAGPLETYSQLGFVTGPGYFPAVGGFTALSGPADSSFVLFALSLPNSALRFQREDDGFVAEYTISLEFMTPDSQLVRQVDRAETVRIPSFKETSRADESVVFQHLTSLAPGRYIVILRVGDANSSRGFNSQDTIEVADFHVRGLHYSQPIVIYEGIGRHRRGEAPDLILNPRHTSPYGGADPRVYIEAYGATEPSPVLVSVLDETGEVVWSTQETIEDGDSLLRHAIFELPANRLPLGRLFVEVGAAGGVKSPPAPLVISLSDQWIVASFDEVLQFVGYIATRAELDSLRKSNAADRRRLWDRFWERRDPIPATPINEFRDEFFQRVRYATDQFAEPPGYPGWRTDRGEVYIVLGPPTYMQERFVGRDDALGRPNAWEWMYESAPGGRLVLLFHDRTGFGRFELTPSSAAAFHAAAGRLRLGPEK
jgi:GWxTD domain-containing protein